MEKIFKFTQSFLNGQLEASEYKNKLLKFSEIVDGNRSGNASLSFIASALDEVANLDSFEEDNKLRIQALVCDIFNNFAHSLMESKTRNVYTDELKSQMFALKKYVVFEIIKECRKTNNKSYGIIDDIAEKDKMFIVDIPGCGQVKWHFPKRIDVYCQQYPLHVVDNCRNLTNKSLILQEKTMSEIRQLSDHNQKVISALDVDEMNEELGLITPTIAGLGDQIKEPTLEELEQLGNREKNIPNISLDVPSSE